jgi:hypothetical protein
VKVIRKELGHDVEVEVLPVSPDLNILIQWPKRYDIVISQATMEHVCRPSIMMENLVAMTTPGGLISVHTHRPLHDGGYHAWPIDCCRFFPDFFIDLGRYLSYEVVKTYMEDTHIFCLARREGKVKELRREDA